MTSHPKSSKDLEDIEKPSTLVSLTFINRGKSSLTGLEKFKNLVKTIQIDLDLSGNTLSSQVSSMLELKFLKKLNLSRNSISVIWELPKSLEQLNLSENFITSLEYSIQSLTKLEYLDVSQNCIGSLKGVGMLKGLRSLYAGKNKICDVEGIFECCELAEIDLEGNNCMELERVFAMESVMVASFKGNPCINDLVSTSKTYNFTEDKEGIFYKNLDKIQLPKFSKFKIVGKKLKKKFPEQKKRSMYRSRLTSMQEIYEQVISEDPEMESLNSSGSEDNILITEDFKKPQVSKLQLDKIEDSLDKISSEKWSTKPEISLDSLLDELVQYCELDKELEKGLNDEMRLETIFRLLKNREDERKKLLVEKKQNENQVLHLTQSKSSLSTETDLKSYSNGVIDALNSQVKALKKQLEDEKKRFLQYEKKLKDRIKVFEEDRFSARLDFSHSYDSDFSDYNERRERLSNQNFTVPNKVAEYIENLLKKISRLVNKNKKLRSENLNLKSAHV